MRSLLYFPFGALAVLFAVMVVYREELGIRFIAGILAAWGIGVILVSHFSGMGISQLFEETRATGRALLTCFEALLAIITIGIAKIRGGYIG